MTTTEHPALPAGGGDDTITVSKRVTQAWRHTDTIRGETRDRVVYGWYLLRRNIRLTLKLMFVYSWRGACRGVRDFARWVYDYDSAALKHHYAGKLEVKDFGTAHSARRHTLRAHGLVIMAVGLPVLFPVLAWVAPVWLGWIAAFVVFCWVVKLIPGKDISEFFIAATIAGLVGWLLPGYLEMIPVPPVWVFVAIGVPLLIWLGYLGRPMDKPVLSGAVAAATEPPLGAPMVIRALTSLGNSKMSPKTQMDPATQITLWTDLHREGPGVIGDFVLPEGVPASFVVGKREEFAAALRRPLGCCWPSVGDKHPGHLVVFITRKPMSQAEQEPWPLLKRGEVNIFHSFPAFTDQKNQWVGLTLAYASMIVGAVPRMGKTFVVRELLLASGLDKRVRVAAIDGKGTGDLSACALYADFYSRGDREEELHRVRDYLRGLNLDSPLILQAASS